MSNGGRVGEQFRSIERQLGLPDGFLTTLTERDDDWSFIIRLHALVEAAITRLVRNALPDERVSAWIYGLNAQGPTGKASLAIALGALSEGEWKMFSALSHLRSAFAHDVAMTAVSLADFFRGQSAEELRGWSAELCATLIAADDSDPADYVDFFTEAPRGILWMVAFVVIDRAYELRLSAWSVTREFPVLAGMDDEPEAAHELHPVEARISA